MSLFLRTVGYLISLPARMKGATFGRYSYVALGYSLMW